MIGTSRSGGVVNAAKPNIDHIHFSPKGYMFFKKEYLKHSRHIDFIIDTNPPVFIFYPSFSTFKEPKQSKL